MKHIEITVFVACMPVKLTAPSNTSGCAYVEACKALPDESTDTIADQADYIRSGKVSLQAGLEAIGQVVLLDSEKKINQVLAFLANELGQAYFDAVDQITPLDSEQKVSFPDQCSDSDDGPEFDFPEQRRDSLAQWYHATETPSKYL